MNEEECRAVFKGTANEVIRRLYELLILYWKFQYKIHPEAQQPNKNMLPIDAGKKYAKAVLEKYRNDPERIISELVAKLNQAGFPVAWQKAPDAYVLKIGSYKEQRCDES